MSKQLALSVAVSVLAMVSFVLLGQHAGAQLARDARTGIVASADYAPLSLRLPILPILN